MILAVRRLYQWRTIQTAPLVILAPANSLAPPLGKNQVLGAIVAEEDTEWHFLTMIPRSSAVTVQYN
jgi:hypothetical protein